MNTEGRVYLSPELVTHISRETRPYRLMTNDYFCSGCAAAGVAAPI